MEAIDDIYEPLAQARGTLVDTLSAYFAHGTSIEPTARALFVHPNTVRYRLGQVADLTGLTPSAAPRCAHPAARAGTRSFVGSPQSAAR